MQNQQTFQPGEFYNNNDVLIPPTFSRSSQIYFSSIGEISSSNDSSSSLEEVDSSYNVANHIRNLGINNQPAKVS
jgi:hypothetical protein